MENKLIEALVKFNDRHAIVLNDRPKLIYKKVGNIIYGTDGLFYQCYKYGKMGEGYKAFGGHKFDILLDSGEIVHCEGQWWNDGFDEVEKITGCKLGSAAVGNIEDLKKCYVFTGYSCDMNSYNELMKNYDGTIFEYYDYEKIIKFDDMRKDGFRRERKLESAKRSLIKEVKRIYKLNK